MTGQMTDTRLIELIETWGADPAGWPEAEQAAGKALLAAHPERFADALGAARGLDDLLGALPDALPSAELTRAIIAAAPRAAPAPKSRARWFGFKAPWMPASGMAAAAFGLMMGLTVAPAASADNDVSAEVQELVISALGFDPENYTLEEIQ